MQAVRIGDDHLACRRDRNTFALRHHGVSACLKTIPLISPAELSQVFLIVHWNPRRQNLFDPFLLTVLPFVKLIGKLHVGCVEFTATLFGDLCFAKFGLFGGFPFIYRIVLRLDGFLFQLTSLVAFIGGFRSCPLRD